MATPAVTLGTPGPSTLPTSSPGPANFTSVVNVDGGMDEGMGDEAEDDEQEVGASNALRTEKDKKKQMQQEGGCQLTTKEIETIFDTRQKAESYGTHIGARSVTCGISAMFLPRQVS